MLRGVGRRGGSVWEVRTEEDDTRWCRLFVWARRGCDFSRASVRPCSALTRDRTWSRRVVGSLVLIAWLMVGVVASSRG